MIYNEVRKNLFAVDKSYFMAHCISTDAEMGKGIAVDFRKHFGLYRTRQAGKAGLLQVGDCFPDGRIMNLVTKKFYYGKPTYDSLRLALFSLLELCVTSNIRRLAMPKIGSGLDRLSWPKVREIIYEVFNGLDIEILVCIKE